MIIDFYHHIRQVGIDPIVVPSSFPSQKHISVTTAVPNLSLSTNPVLAPSNKPSSLPSTEPSVEPYKDPSSEPTYFPSGYPTADPIFVPTNFRS